ncbi:hypothetical protein FQN52_006630 [Onygenales sp. PD_12]|nr:hypothetical protein FQN52_006630 [Onygenales sp. PD_12]
MPASKAPKSPIEPPKMPQSAVPSSNVKGKDVPTTSPTSSSSVSPSPSSLSSAASNTSTGSTLSASAPQKPYTFAELDAMPIERLHALANDLGVRDYNYEPEPFDTTEDLNY